MYGRTYISIAIIFSALVYSFFLNAHAAPAPLPIRATTTSAASAIVAAEFTREARPSLSEAYSVTKVVDGDTLAVDINGVSTTLRLIGLDTPETVDPRKPVQCFGKEASDKAKELLAGKKCVSNTIHRRAHSTNTDGRSPMYTCPTARYLMNT